MFADCRHPQAPTAHPLRADLDGGGGPELLLRISHLLHQGCLLLLDLRTAHVRTKGNFHLSSTEMVMMAVVVVVVVVVVEVVVTIRAMETCVTYGGNGGDKKGLRRPG